MTETGQVQEGSNRQETKRWNVLRENKQRSGQRSVTATSVFPPPLRRTCAMPPHQPRLLLLLNCLCCRLASCVFPLLATNQHQHLNRGL